MTYKNVTFIFCVAFVLGFIAAQIWNVRGTTKVMPEEVDLVMSQLQLKYIFGPFILYASKDHQTFLFGKNSNQEGKVPQIIVAEIKNDDDNSISSSYYGFGGPGGPIFNVEADISKGKVTRLSYEAQSSMSYPHSPNLDANNYFYLDSNADGTWDIIHDQKKGIIHDIRNKSICPTCFVQSIVVKPEL